MRSVRTPIRLAIPIVLLASLAIGGVTTSQALIPSTEFVALEAAYFPVLEAPPDVPPDTPRSLLSRVADEYGISSTTLFNLAWSESRLHPDAIGDGGCSVGIVQLNLCVHKTITREQALDPAWALRFAASEIAAGRAYQWSPCSCVKGARNLGLPLPPISSPRDLIPNSAPKSGAGVILRYGLTWHVAVIANVTETGMNVREFNYQPCKYTERFVASSTSEIVGYWTP